MKKFSWGECRIKSGKLERRARHKARPKLSKVGMQMQPHFLVKRVLVPRYIVLSTLGTRGEKRVSLPGQKRM